MGKRTGPEEIRAEQPIETEIHSEKEQRLAPESWAPPGRNCGLCGSQNCGEFLEQVTTAQKRYNDCPFYNKQETVRAPNRGLEVQEALYDGRDVLGHRYDFVLAPLPGEISARKIVLPFRSDLVDKLAIGKGDLVVGRPMGAGCPVPHVLRVIEASPITGLLTTWVVGPQYARDHPVKEVDAYHMVGFEGLAVQIEKQPEFGCRVTFLPGFCMMNLNHTGLVNMLLKQTEGYHVRIEDIRILAGI